jgi:HD-GYP domain-containing protein (c-di-GMP phosphodiesterase class II)
MDLIQRQALDPVIEQSRSQPGEPTPVTAQAAPQRAAPGDPDHAATWHSAVTQLLLVAADRPAPAGRDDARLIEVERTTLELVMSMINVVEAWDTETGGHSQRVTQVALRIARVLGWTLAQRRVLAMGGWLHDIGKMGIPDGILQKAAPLTPAEYRAMQAHVMIGLRILDGVPALAAARPYVAYHHERYDGQGYPFGLAGLAIPVEGRLLAVADAFDAITSARPYRPARSVEEGLREVEAQRGTQFDPDMVDALHAAYASGLLVPAALDMGRPPVAPMDEWDRATPPRPVLPPSRPWSHDEAGTVNCGGPSPG